MSLTQQWKLQDNAASTTVVATVGTDGTLLGGDNTSTLSVASGPGTALTRSLDFNGTDDAVDISGSSLSFASGDSWSVAAWFYVDAFTSNHAVMGRSDSNASRLQLQGTATQFRISLNAGGDNNFTVPTVSTATWYHVLVTYAAGSLRVFLNGTESSTGTISNSQTFTPTRIARAGSFYWNGKLCDVRVYNSDESANVAAIMAEKDVAGGPYPFHTDNAMAGGTWGGSC